MSPLRIFYTRISQASILLPIISGSAYYKKLDPAFRIFFYFFVLSAGVEILSTSIKGNNLPVLHLFSLIEFLVFSTVYYLHFQKNSRLRLLIGINMIAGLTAALVDVFYINDIWSMNTFSRSYYAVSIVIYTLVYFYSLFQKDSTSYGWEHPMYWVSVGALIYFGINTLYFMLVKYLLDNKPLVETYTLFMSQALNLIANFLFAKAFRCFRKTALS